MCWCDKFCIEYDYILFSDVLIYGSNHLFAIFFSLFLVVFVCFPLYPICMFSVQILLKKEWNSNHFISFVFTDICILIFKTDIFVRLESCFSSTKQTHAWHSINILFICFGSSNISVFLLYFISLNVRMNDFIVVFSIV